MEVEAGQLLKIPLVELVQYKSNVYKQYQVQKKGTGSKMREYEKSYR